MILQQVGDYLRQRGEATLREIALHVDADESAVETMLWRWMRSGRVTRIQQSASCAGRCQSCGSQQGSDLYRWSARRGLKIPLVVLPTSPSA